MSSVRVGLTMAALLCAGLLVGAEDIAATASEPDVIKADVVVAGSRHRVVTDLTRDDFTIEEDGKPAEIATFESRPTYYVIGFHPIAGKSESQWRKIRVVVKRKGLDAASLRGYRLQDERTRSTK